MICYDYEKLNNMGGIMASLSKDEARDIVKDMLSTIRIGINDYGEANIHIAEIEKMYDSVRREGNTSDVFCKIAGAAFEQGIATDVGTTKHTGMVMRFWPADPKYKAPSSEICKTRWRKMKKISDKGYAGPPSYIIGREVDTKNKA